MLVPKLLIEKHVRNSLRFGYSILIVGYFIIMKNKITFLLIGFWFFMVTTRSNAQSNCDNLFKDAVLLYETGHYDSLLTSVKNGMTDCKFSRITIEQLYALMIMAQVENDNVEEAQKLTLKLLKLNPNYKLGQLQGSTAFRSMFEKFKVRPLLSVGLTAGLNFSFAQQLNTYSILDSADYSKPYSSITGTQFSCLMELEFLKNFCVGAQATINNQKYERLIDGINNWQLSFIETSSSYDFPFYLKYYHSLKNFKPYVKLGYNISVRQNSTADVELHYTAYNAISQSYDEYQQASNGINTGNMRTKNNKGMIFGLGVAYQKNNFRFFFDASYNKALTEYVNKENRFSNEDLNFNYYYIDNDIRLSKMEVNVGVAYILLHHFKMKK
jgi:hypothetical protein